MIEMTLYGRGGQGGVTLAKLIATAYFQRGKFSQAFGVYAAERSGAPIQAYVRVDDEEIENTNQIREPDHVIVLDPTLVGDGILAGASPQGWVILNTTQQPAFSGRHVATIDATGIAVRHGLGTRTVPIVNTTMMGAIARVFGFSFNEVLAVFESLGFGGANVDAASEAFESVVIHEYEGEPLLVQPARNTSPIAGLLDANVGKRPTIRTGSWATRRPQNRSLTPPCNAICPAGNDVQRFIEAASKNDFDGALAVLLETTPFPGVCGRVCPAPCMESCNRNLIDEGIDVRQIERFAGDNAQWPVPSVPMRKERVAVVGAGPAGISAAYQLAKRGIHVSLFEAADELGGVLRNGIPDFRLPKHVVDREIGFVLMHGVSAYVDATINAAALRDLTDHYDAVFVATGLQTARTLDLGGPVEQGIVFLDRVHRHDVVLHGQHVVVVGGGNTAIDAARSSLRLGAASVRILYRRSRAEMPAIREEIEEAIHEGVELVELALPYRFDERQLRCVRMILGELDASGRRRPIVDPTSNFTIPCDHVILALGQEADRSILDKSCPTRTWFGGDFDTNAGTVAAAIGSGRRAAEAIFSSLVRGADVSSARPRTATIDDIHPRLFTHQRRQTNARTEAQRCLSCGVCNSCDRCVQHCPEGILTRADQVTFDYDYCKGCGVCASECPRGAIVMAEL